MRSFTDVFIMPTIDSALKKLQKDFPALTFHAGELFRWEPAGQTVFYNETEPDALCYLLHEVGHATLNHDTYSRDIELVAMERDAWQHAKTVLAPDLEITIPAHIVEDSLDTYRDWLHSRSTCPVCNANGIQTDEREYTCVVCRNTWLVNQATGCQLKRYTKKRLD